MFHCHSCRMQIRNALAHKGSTYAKLLALLFLEPINALGYVRSFPSTRCSESADAVLNYGILLVQVTSGTQSQNRRKPYQQEA